MRGAQTAVTIVPILEPHKFLSILLPSMALLPDLYRLDKGKEHLHRTRPVHLLTDDRLHLLNGSQTKGEIGVNPRGQFSDHPCPEHELMAGDFRLGGDFLQGRK
jgi:hypothetical protein